MDYKSLLKKYINHVGNEEGCDFVGYIYGNDLFTKEDILELERISAEIESDNQQAQAERDNRG